MADGEEADVLLLQVSGDVEFLYLESLARPPRRVPSRPRKPRSGWGDGGEWFVRGGVDGLAEKEL